MPKRTVQSEIGPLDFWGSECLACHNATPDTMRCDECQSSLRTVRLYMEREVSP